MSHEPRGVHTPLCCSRERQPPRVAYKRATMLARRVAAGVRTRRGLSTLTPGVPTVPGATSGTASNAASSAASSEAAAVAPVDNRPWPVRNWGTTLFLTLVSSWAYSLWVQNKTRKAQEAVEDAVKSRLPANSDELLELRALNDIPTAAIGSLPQATARVGSPMHIGTQQLMGLLREVLANGDKLKEEYVVERILMALPQAASAPRLEAMADVRLATGALAFLSSGPVGERLDNMYDLLCGGDSDAGVESSTLAPLLQVLMATGQVPPEKMVHVVDVGKDPVFNYFSRSWYLAQPVQEFTAEQWAAELLAAHGIAEPARATEEDPSAAESVAAAAASDSPTQQAQPATIAKERIDRTDFINMMQSERVCLWGECYQIRERLKLQKQRDEAEEALANPPWYHRAWNAVSGVFSSGDGS